MQASNAATSIAKLAGCALSGVALWMAFPPHDLWWLMFGGIAGFVITLRSRRDRYGFGYGVAFGLGFMLPLVHWVSVVGVDAWLALAVLESAFYGLMALAWTWTRSSRWWPLAYAATWVGAELLRSVVPFGGFPWGTLAFGLADTPVARLGRLGGTGLVSFVVVLSVGLAVDAVERRATAGPAIGRGVCAVALIAVSAMLPVGISGSDGRTRIAAVQGNVPLRPLGDAAERRAVIRNHVTATEHYVDAIALGRRPQPDIVIWPENSVDIDPFYDLAVFDEINNAVRAIGVPTLVGAVLFAPDGHHDLNVGIVWSPTTGPGQIYEKQHLVPFGEYIPMRGFFSRFIPQLSQIPVDMAPGNRAGILRMGHVTIGDLMCFEVAYDGLVRGAVAGGGHVIVVQTNNATYAGSDQLAQQFAISRYRAIEAGRAVVVASTDGISGVIAPDGSVMDASAVHTRRVISANVPLGDEVTLGVRIGGPLKAALALLGLLLAIVAYLDGRRDVGKMAACPDTEDSSSSRPTTKQPTSNSSSIG